MLLDNQRVVVTGMGAISPIGNTVDEFWKNAVNGVSGVTPITKSKSDLEKYGFNVFVAGEVKDFVADKFLDKKLVRRNDEFVHYACAAAYEAIQQAGLHNSEISKERIGVIVGSGIGGIRSFENNMLMLLEKKSVSPFLIPSVITDMAAGVISIQHGFMGPNFSVATACATANHAILNAYHTLRRGEADAIIAGGTEGTLTLLSFGGFTAAHALTSNPDPSTASRPWDKNRDGFVMGEGAAILVLETLESAKKRSAKVYAEILGGGMSADAHHITAPHPEGKGAILAVTAALKSANIKPEDVQYINAHGTSTPLGDIAETKTIKTVFGSHAAHLKVNSTKSLTGHLLGAAGGIEAIASIQTLLTGVIHPTINLRDPDPECDLDYVPNQAIKHDVNIAISNSFGFGGHNCTIVIKRYES